METLENNLHQARVSAVKGDPASISQYAVILNQLFKFDWFSLSGTDNSANGKLVRAERNAFVEALRELNFDYTINPNTTWTRIRAAAQSERCPNPDLVKPPKVS